MLLLIKAEFTVIEGKGPGIARKTDSHTACKVLSLTVQTFV